MHKPSDPLALADACASRALRDRWHLAYLEGVAPFLHACEAGLTFEALLHSPILLRSSRAQRLVRRKRAAGVPCVKLEPERFRDHSRAARASGIAAVVRQRWRALERVDAGAGSVWVALERILSPGNLGTILRTLEASGARGLIALGDSLDPYDLEPIRASMGAVFHLDLVRTTLPELSSWARRRRVEVVGTRPSGECDYTAPYAPRTVLAIGEERSGMSRALEEACTRTVRIPVLGRGDSLNVGVAAGVLVYEVLRQRRAR